MSTSQTESPKPTAERLAYSVDEFCESVGVSRSFYYAMSDAEKPRSIKRGRRIIIPADAVKAWLAGGEVA